MQTTIALAETRETELSQQGSAIVAESKTFADRRLEQAVVLESAGRSDLATQIIEAPIAVPSVAAPVAIAPRIETPHYVAPKDAGLRTTWKFRIVDPNLIPREYLTPDLVKIGAVIRSTKGTLTIPGIEAYADQTANLK